MAGIGHDGRGGPRAWRCAEQLSISRPGACATAPWGLSGQGVAAPFTVGAGRPGADRIRRCGRWSCRPAHPGGSEQGEGLHNGARLGGLAIVVGPTLFALDGAGGAAGLGDTAGGMVARGLVDQQGQGFEQRRSELVSPVCVHGAASVTVGAFAARSAKIRCRPRHGRRAGVAGRARSVRMESAMFRSSFWGAGAQCAQ